MKTTLYATVAIFFILLKLPESLAHSAEACDIYVHGFTPNGEDYFGKQRRQVVWNANRDFKDSAPDVAKQILELHQQCPINSPIVLRPHSYGAAVTQYILARGFEFKDIFPHHDFVQVYKKTVEVYAYTGAYHGTPLMDLVCSSRVINTLAGLFGNSCVQALTTSKVHNVAHRAITPGVATHLITSNNRKGFLGIPGSILSKHMVSFWSFIRGVRNQNDNTLPLYATRACQKKTLLKSATSNCTKIDQNYFIDFHHTNIFNHTGFISDSDFLNLKNVKDDNETEK